ncbi:MAG: hypothetical protein ACRC6M_16555 [Microcystaceae cyanobacterium]
MSDHPSPSKTEIITQLQASIGQLETVVQKLQSDSEFEPNLERSLTTLTSLSNQLAESLTLMLPPEPPGDRTVEPSTVKPKSAAKLIEKLPAIAEEEEPSRVMDRLLPELNQVENGWDWILVKIRGILPQSINEKLSDWGLTSVLAGIVVALLLTSVMLVSERPASIPEIAENSSNSQETAVVEKPTPLNDVIPTPPNLEAPAEAEPIELAPPPEPPLTPEQSLLGAIQQEVKDLTRQYPDGLIVAIAPNFEQNQLTLNLANSWYELTPKRQEMLVNGIFKRARKLTFQKVSIRDTKGELLARSPVVGLEMIVIKRQQEI